MDNQKILDYLEKNESLILLCFMKCKGKLPDNIKVAKEHVINCSFCMNLAEKKIKATNSKIYISKRCDWQDEIEKRHRK